MILDIIIIVFILLGIYSGYKKGMAVIITSFIGLILSLGLAFVFSSPLTNYITSNNEFFTNIQTKVKDVISAPISDDKQESLYDSMIQNMGATGGIDEVSNMVTKLIIKIGSFIIIFISVSIIIFIIQSMLNLVFDLPILSSINKLGGLAVGLLLAVIKVWVLLAITYVFVSILPNIADIINKTTVTKALYQNNFIISILQGEVNE